MTDPLPLVRRFAQSTPVKIAVLGTIVVVLLLPLARVSWLVNERAARRAGAAEEIARAWAGAQTLTGPILTVPYREVVPPSEDSIRASLKAGLAPPQPTLVQFPIHLLPRALALRGAVSPETRRRGIFATVVYEAQLDVEGAFEIPDTTRLGASPHGELLWQEAHLSLGIAQVRGIADRALLRLGERTLAFEPGVPAAPALASGMHAPLRLERPLAAGATLPFSFTLGLRGSGRLHVFPAGEETTLTLSSSWHSPSFDGAQLPSERTVGPSGFTATWRATYLGRSVAQRWTGNQVDQAALLNDSFGVNFYLPADGYHKTERSVKYGLLFITLTCATFFLIELVSPVRLHAMHYLLVGSALVLFYLLLLALSEHTGFGRAYLVAAAVCTTLVGAYARSVLRSLRFAATLLVCLGGLYGYLYVLLQAEDYALLLGAVGLFAVLALLMYLTRRLDWRSLQFEGTS